MDVPATHDELRQRLDRAAKAALEVARMFVGEVLHESVLFLIDPNRSYDGNPLEGDEQVFPNDSANGRIGPLDSQAAAAWLWRDGKVPEWVNVTAFDVVGTQTHVRLECCGRFTASDKHLYHRREGYPPFHVLGPSVPFDWESVEKSGHVLLEGRRPSAG
jgi:hypothetical protein